MIVEGGDAFKGYWCVGTSSVTMQTAKGKQCLSAEMHISTNMTRTSYTSDSVLHGCAFHFVLSCWNTHLIVCVLTTFCCLLLFVGIHMLVVGSSFFNDLLVHFLHELSCIHLCEN